MLRDGKITDDFKRPEPTIPNSIGHHREWIQAIKTGGTTTITDFDDGVVGQSFTLLGAHILTITHNASIIALNGAGNFAMKVGDTLTLTMFNDQVWQEVSRTTLA